MDDVFSFDSLSHSEFVAVSASASESLLSDRKSLAEIFSCIDNTSLNSTDTSGRIETFCENTLHLQDEDKGIPHVASVCVYPSHVATAKKVLSSSGIAVAAVAGGFPVGQIPVQLKANEVKYIVDAGADEVDYVINRGAFINGERNYTYDEVALAKEQCKDKKLKVILETGELGSVENIYDAAIVVLQAGADFVKTSTGKIQCGATPEAAAAILMAVRDFSKKTGKNVGFKASGGISTPQEALIYLYLTKKILDKKEITNQIFRIGASRLTNNLFNYLTF